MDNFEDLRNAERFFVECLICIFSGKGSFDRIVQNISARNKKGNSFVNFLILCYKQFHNVSPRGRSERFQIIFILHWTLYL